MKRVFASLSDVIHVYAQRSQELGESGSVFFDGDKIYSYGRHYLLGEFINDTTIIINDKGYSSSTGRHIGMLRSATRQYRQLFKTDIDINLVSHRIKDNADKLKNARKPEKYVTEIINSFETLESYLKEFKKVNILKGEEFKEIKKIYSALKKDEGKYLEQAKDKYKKEKEKAETEFKKNLNKFFSYEVNRLYSGDIKEDYLRISLDGTKVETTQSVKIDVEDARNLYKMIKAGVDIAGERIGNYRVNSLNGHLVIGCHRINVKNMHEVGGKLLINA
jgi:hypothetical protein